MPTRNGACVGAVKLRRQKAGVEAPQQRQDGNFGHIRIKLGPAAKTVLCMCVCVFVCACMYDVCV
jgi:hypothetical protein